MCLALAVTGCSTSVEPRTSARPTPSAAAASPVATPAADGYADAVLADRPLGLWPLADASEARPGQAVEDRSPRVGDATLVEGRVGRTTGPLGAHAAAFNGTGRLVTPLVDVLRSGRPFTIELFFRPDDCTRHWTQVVGTAAYTAAGRQGVNVLHYPRFFPAGCHLAVEFWRDDRYTGGCGLPAVTRTGSWVHFAVTYDGRTARCYLDARPVSVSKVAGFGSDPTAPFGIGGAGSGYAGTLDSGSLAHVAVYDRALAPSQLRRHVAARAR